MDSRILYVTRTGLLLAVTLILQGLRLFFPVPPQISMFVIGSLVNACLLLAVLQIGWKAAVLLAVVTPVAAYLQGMLLFFPFIGPVALGNAVFVLLFFYLRRQRIKGFCVAAMAKAAVLYGAFYGLFGMVAFSGEVRHMILFVMSWPQLITALLGGMIACAVAGRVPAILHIHPGRND